MKHAGGIVSEHGGVTFSDDGKGRVTIHEHGDSRAPLVVMAAHYELGGMVRCQNCKGRAWSKTSGRLNCCDNAGLVRVLVCSACAGWIGRPADAPEPVGGPCGCCNGSSQVRYLQPAPAAITGTSPPARAGEHTSVNLYDGPDESTPRVTFTGAGAPTMTVWGQDPVDAARVMLRNGGTTADALRAAVEASRGSRVAPGLGEP